LLARSLVGAINALIHFYLRFAAKVIFSAPAQSGHWGFALGKKASEIDRERSHSIHLQAKPGLKATGFLQIDFYTQATKSLHIHRHLNFCATLCQVAKLNRKADALR